MTKDLWVEFVPLLKWLWSPVSFVGVMRRYGWVCVSAEWIFHFVRMVMVCGRILFSFLPLHLKLRLRPVSALFHINYRFSFDEWHAVVDAMTRFGDWVMDSFIGKDG